MRVHVAPHVRPRHAYDWNYHLQVDSAKARQGQALCSSQTPAAAASRHELKQRSPAHPREAGRPRRRLQGAARPAALSRAARVRRRCPTAAAQPCRPPGWPGAAAARGAAPPAHPPPPAPAEPVKPLSGWTDQDNPRCVRSGRAPALLGSHARRRRAHGRAMCITARAGKRAHARHSQSAQHPVKR